METQDNLYITPCIGVCHIDRDTRVCKGCNRTIDEISSWSKMSYEDRMVVMHRLGFGKRRKK